MRIFHIVENLDKGAVETWLVNTFICSRFTKPEWEWTFYCILGKAGQMDQQVLNAGGNIIYAPVTISQKIPFLTHLRHSLKAKSYDILHVHHDYLSGFYLLAALGLNIPKKILHIHNNDRALPVGNRYLHGALLWPFHWLSLKMTDVAVGISKNTLYEYLHSAWILPRKKTKVLYYGVEFDKQLSPYISIKTELAIPPYSKIILFVGRMNRFKNPLFVLEILKEINLSRSDIYALFIGQGELEPVLKGKVDEYNLAEKVRILGWRSDIKSIMQQADIFIFPRLEFPKEGLGLVVIEAQAAGLPSLVTNGIVPDAIIIRELVSVLNLDDTKVWTAKTIQVLESGKPYSSEEARQLMNQSHFELHHATTELIGLYENDLNKSQ